MVIKRDNYLQKIHSKKGNGKVKIITGIRRCGKSYLLSQLYKDRLISEGAVHSQFVEIALNQQEFTNLRNPYNLRWFCSLFSSIMVDIRPCPQGSRNALLYEGHDRCCP